MSRYDDIIDLPHYEPKHKRMTMENRAAQFAPFAALTGHGAAIAETARLTDNMTELSTDEQLRLSRILNYAYEKHIQVTLTYFLPDTRKAGGKYENASGIIKKIDETDRILTLSNGPTILIDLIHDIKLTPNY
ncbi:MAG: YolD-like family protein [Muribaculaceae bacterium]|nr:YolD-like family protein [Muribaculaceae bacterium]